MPLHESTLEEIYSRLPMSATDDSHAMLVCPSCKGLVPLDAVTFRRATKVPAPAIPQRGPRLFFRVGRCGKSNCEAPQLFVGVRTLETTEEQFDLELTKMDGAYCPRGHRVVQFL